MPEQITRSEQSAGAPRFVLDASALLAMMEDAPGGSLVGVKLYHSAISAVNLSEIIEYCCDHSIEVDSMIDNLISLGLIIEPFRLEDARKVAEMTTATADSSLTLKDRVCLALAARLEVPAITADQTWLEVDVGVEIRVLR